MVWDRVRGTVAALPVPFIGRQAPGGRPSLEEDEVEQALRHQLEDTPDIEQPLLQSTNADRQAPCFNKSVWCMPDTCLPFCLEQHALMDALTVLLMMQRAI